MSSRRTSFSKSSSLLQGRFAFRRALLALASVTLATSGAYAQTQIWTGTSTGTWSAAGNWNPTGTPTSTTVAEFNSGANTVTTGTVASAAGSVWVTGSVTGLTSIGGTATLTITGGQTVNGVSNAGILLDDAGNFGLTTSAPVALGGSTNFDVNNTGTLTIGALILGANTVTLNASTAAGAIAMNSTISGTGGVIVNSTGTVGLNVNNSFTGGLKIFSGTVAINNALSMGGATGTVTLGNTSGSASATILDSANTTITTPSIVVAAGSTGTLTIGATGNSAIYSGSITLNNNLTVDNLTATKTTTLSGIITEGTSGLTITKGAGVGAVSITNTITIASSGTVTLANIGTGSLSLAVGTENSAGTFDTQANGSGSIVISSNMSGSSTQVLTNNGTGTGTVTLSGIAGTHLTINENSSTSELLLNSTANNGASANVLNGLLQIGNGTGIFNGTGTVTVASTGTLGIQLQTGATMSASIVNNGLTVLTQASGVANTLSGVISGSGNIIDNNSGTLTLGSANTYTGTLTVNGGTVFAAGFNQTGSDSFGTFNTTTGSAGNLVLNGAELGYENGNSWLLSSRLFTMGPGGADIDVSGSALTQALWFTNAGAIGFSTPNVTETLTLSGTKGVTAHNTPSLFYNVFSPQITDNGTAATTLVKTGVGTWVVSGSNNSYSGGTVISGGSLNIQTPGGAGTGSISVASGASLILSYAGTTYTTNAAEFGTGLSDLIAGTPPESDPTTLAYFIDNRTGGMAAGSTLGIDPTDLNGTSDTVTGTATVIYTGDSNGNLTLNNGVNLARYSTTGNESNVANLVISANVSLGSGGFQIFGGVGGYTELSGNNSYTGTTLLTGGELMIGSNTALGNASGAGTSEIEVNGSTTIALDSSVYTSTGTASAYTISAPIDFIASTVGQTLNLSIGTAATPASANINFTGAVTGSDPILGSAGFTIQINGVGGEAQFSGPIYINDGLSSGVTDIENFDAAAFGTGSDITITGNIADAPTGSLGGIGEMVSFGQSSGTIALLGQNTYSGVTALFRGLLQVQTLGNYTNGTPNTQASSLGSPTSQANGMIGLTTQSSLSDIGTTNETSNRSIVLTPNGGTTGTFTLDYSGTGTLNIQGTVAPAFTPTSVTDTLNLQGSTSGKGIISGVVGTAPTAAFNVTNIAAATVTSGAGATTATITMNVNDPMNLYFANGSTITGTNTVSGLAVTGTVTSVGNNTITVVFPATASTTYTFAANASMQIAGSGGAGTSGVTGNVSVLKQGTGTWELANTANTYNGATTINAGTLQVTHLTNEGSAGGTASSLGVSSNAATNLVLNGGTLQYIGSGDTTDRNFQLGVNGGTIDSSGTGSLVLTGTPSYTSTNQGRQMTLTGTNTGLNTLSTTLVDNGTGALALTKNGVGTWVLSGSNANSGNVTINGGILSASTLGNIGTNFSMTTTAGSSTITLSAGTTGSLTVGEVLTGNTNIPDGSTVTQILSSTQFVISSGTGVTAGAGVTTLTGTATSLGIGTSAVTINGGTLQYTGTTTTTNRGISIGANGATLDASGTGAVDFTGGVSFSATGATHTLTLTGTNTGTNTLANALNDDTGTAPVATSLLKTGSGTWYLGAANTFTGSVTIANGVLGVNTLAALGSTQSLGKGTGTVTLGSAGLSSGTLLFTGTTGTLSQSIASTGNGGDTIQNGGTGLLTIGGGVSKNGTTLTLNAGTGGIKVTGTISGANANSDLDVTSGTTTLSTAATYNGATWVYGGGVLVNGVSGGALPTNTMLNIGTPGSAGVATSTVTTAGTFDLNANNQTVAGLNTEGNGPSYTNDIVTNNGSGTGTATLTVTGGGNFAGVIQNGATAKTAVSETGGVLALSGSNTYSGGTSVTSGGTVIVSNTGNGSATGSGSLSVTGNGSTIGGYGQSSSTSFNIAGTGTATGSRANVLVGMNSASDINTTQVLTLLGAATSTITNANLTFNLSATTAGALGSNPAGSGTELAVGGTLVSFGTNVASVSLSLNIQNEPAVIAAFTPYVLIAGTGVTTDSSGVSGGQYTGLSLGTVTTLSPGVTETIITGNNLQLAFGSATDSAWYQAHSYLVLYQNSLTGVDDIDVIVVPEPGTWALMLGGLGLLIFWQCRKNSQR